MDIGLPKMSGIECVEKLRERAPDIPVMMLTVYEDDDRIFKSLVAGASGYILKHNAGAVVRGDQGHSRRRFSMSNLIARRVVRTFQQMETSSKELENLSGGKTKSFLCS